MEGKGINDELGKEKGTYRKSDRCTHSIFICINSMSETLFMFSQTRDCVFKENIQKLLGCPNC